MVGTLRETSCEVSSTATDVQHPPNVLRESPQQSTVIVGVVVPMKHRPRLEAGTQGQLAGWRAYVWTAPDQTPQGRNWVGPLIWGGRIPVHQLR